MHDRAGNLPPLPGIFPDYSAPIVRNQPDGRELTLARWGMPSPLFALKGRNSDSGVTNVRNVSSPHWRRWLGIESRCVVPFTITFPLESNRRPMDRDFDGPRCLSASQRYASGPAPPCASKQTALAQDS
jgi:hypothetical protein